LPLSGNLRGALWMLASMVFFSGMTLVIRFLSPNIPPVEQVFVRGVVSVVLLLPWLIRTGPAGLKTRRLPMLALRAACTGVAILAWIYGIQRLPLADATALHFTIPLFAVLLAMVLLRERVVLHRWIALGIGFSGALLVLRPGFADISFAGLIVLLSALVYALGNIVSKVLVRTETPALIVFYLNALLMLAFAVPTALVWVWPSPVEWLFLLAFGLGNVLAQLCITRAFKLADLSAVLPFEFTRLPMLALAGFVLFGERPGIWTWIGAVVIFGAAYYVVWREKGAH